VSKVTLDIIAETAFGYQVNSVLDPHNELAEAYETLVNLQTRMSAVNCLESSLTDRLLTKNVTWEN
jgi:hypothetical protein